MMGIEFKLEKVADEVTGELHNTIMRYSPDPNSSSPIVESMMTVTDIMRLRAACETRWPDGNWDLEKVIVVIQETEIE